MFSVKRLRALAREINQKPPIFMFVPSAFVKPLKDTLYGRVIFPSAYGKQCPPVDNEICAFEDWRFIELKEKDK